MRFISWAALYEGPSDRLYLDVLVPRVIRELVANEGGQTLVEIPDTPALTFDTRVIAEVAAAACDARDAFDLLIVHADTGGRGLAAGIDHRAEAVCVAMAEHCAFAPDRCVTLMPRHETEAWLLADAHAVTSALGYTGDPGRLGLPADAAAAERSPDPKRILKGAIETVAGRRRRQSPDNLFPAIAQRQSIERLRVSASFRQFEERLRTCLRSLSGVIA